MAVLSEVVTVGDVLKYETPWQYCREKITLKQVAGQTVDMPIGQCLELDGTKAVVVATGGSCYAVLLETVPFANLVAGDVEAVALVRGPAVLDSTRLTVVALQKTTALAALLVLRIVSRAEPTYTVAE